MKLINLGNRPADDGLPDVRFRPALADYVAEVTALLPVLALWGYVLVCRLREEAVAPQFYATGGMALGCFVLLFVVSRCSVRHINFPFRVSRRNVAYQYVLALRVCRALNVCIGWMLFFSSFMEAGHRWAGGGFVLSLLLLTVSLAGYTVLAYRHR